jgi:hypothetical protein
VGLETLLGFVFIVSSSALTGVVLARRKRASGVGRGTVLADQSFRELSLRRSGELTLAAGPDLPGG